MWRAVCYVLGVVLLICGVAELLFGNVAHGALWFVGGVVWVFMPTVVGSKSDVDG